jgi:hypothetical protein
MGKPKTLSKELKHSTGLNHLTTKKTAKKGQKERKDNKPEKKLHNSCSKIWSTTTLNENGLNLQLKDIR